MGPPGPAYTCINQPEEALKRNLVYFCHHLEVKTFLEIDYKAFTVHAKAPACTHTTQTHTRMQHMCAHTGAHNTHMQAHAHNTCRHRHTCTHTIICKRPTLGLAHGYALKGMTLSLRGAGHSGCRGQCVHLRVEECVQVGASLNPKSRF